MRFFAKSINITLCAPANRDQSTSPFNIEKFLRLETQPVYFWRRLLALELSVTALRSPWEINNRVVKWHFKMQPSKTFLLNQREKRATAVKLSHFNLSHFNPQSFQPSVTSRRHALTNKTAVGVIERYKSPRINSCRNSYSPALQDYRILSFISVSPYFLVQNKS